MTRIVQPQSKGYGALSAFCCSMAWVAAALAGDPSSSDRAAPFDQVMGALQQRHPGLKLTADDGVIQLYGTPFEEGLDPKSTSEQFIHAYAESLFGARPADLLQNPEGFTEQPVMYEAATGTYKFTLLTYRQYREGLEVYESDLRLLVRNQPNHPLVWAASTLRRLGDYAPAQAALAFDPSALGHTQLETFTRVKTVIYAGSGAEKVQPQVANVVIGENDPGKGEDYSRKEFVVDAAGAILHEKSLIVFENVTGQVQGVATVGIKSDFCSPETAMALPYAEARIMGGTTVFADAAGSFSLPYVPGTTIESRMRGQYFTVDNVQGAEDNLTAAAVSGAPLTFVHNMANGDLIRSQVNAYIHANIVRDFTLLYNPSYPNVANRTSYPIFVNRTDGYCPGNAWYNGSSINFCSAGGIFSNTAFASVVYHEYGHHLVANGGSGDQDQYGEGMGDVVAMLIADDPVLGYGFRITNCNSGLRSAQNQFQYPCEGEAHDCGRLLSGAIWSVRTELAQTYPGSYVDIVSNLAINSILMHTTSVITPAIADHFLTLDDNDGNLANGTPHFREICIGFGAHNMHCSNDCNADGIPDAADISGGISNDCNDDNVPDECIGSRWGQQDCNNNLVPDDCDIVAGASNDCNANGIPDECNNLETDCNDNFVPDDCDITSGASLDFDGDNIPNECDYCARQLQQRLTPANGTYNAGFGFSAAVTQDLAAVGAPFDNGNGNNSGAVYLFVKAPDGSWTQEAKLVTSNIAGGAGFGYVVRVAGSDRVVVGAPWDTSAGGGLAAGSAFVFAKPPGGQWTEQAKLVASDGAANDWFGRSLAVDGDVVAVGAPFDDTPGGYDSGSAYVFRRQPGDSWLQEAQLTVAEGMNNDWLGTAVAVSGDAMVATAPNRDQPATSPTEDSGAAYVFRRQPNGDWNLDATLVAPDVQTGDRFGSAASMWGDSLVISAPSADLLGDDSGSVYVFRRDASQQWLQEAKLASSDGATGDAFGSAVSIHQDMIAVGASADDDGSDNSGSAYIFARGLNGAWNQKLKLTGWNNAEWDYFGSAVAVSNGIAVAGAYSMQDPVGGPNFGATLVIDQLVDCNANTAFDICDIEWGVSQDGDGNGIVDECECTPAALAWAHSVAAHRTGPTAAAEFYVNLVPTERTSESRDSGIRILEFQFDRSVNQASLEIANQSGQTVVDTALTLLPGDNGPTSLGRVELPAALPNGHGYTLTVHATFGLGCEMVQTVCAAALAGDFDNDGSVTAADKATLQGFLFQPIAQENARYDLQVNGDPGTIGVGDLGAWSGFFGTQVSPGSCE